MLFSENALIDGWPSKTVLITDILASVGDGLPCLIDTCIARQILDWTGLDHLHCWRSMTWLSDTIVLHNSRSCAILVHSATDDPIQSLMSSVHRLLGQPRRFLPLIQPWRTAVHRLSALAVCPKNCNFRRWMSFRSRVSSPISSRMDWFVRCSFQLIRNMRRYDVISKALILFLSSTTSPIFPQLYMHGSNDSYDAWP